MASVALFLGACQIAPERAPAIGEAYVGPATLKIRSDIPLESPVVATVKHGARLELLQRRRRFFRVRTPSGAEGWTHERELLSSADMQKLTDLTKSAARMPVQGQASTFGDLNVHTQPSRQSPSFIQVRENEKVDVLIHVVAPRTEIERAPLVPPAPKKSKTKEKAKEPRYPPLTTFRPPGAPADWLELSKTELPVEDPEGEDGSDEAKQQAAPAKPVPVDDWSLVRTKSGEAGWVLTRRLVMAIPDEVAQYAEGRRIVSYFSLGAVQDGDQTKHNWLWTTVGEGVHPYDFDSFRVFIWSLHRHRFETAYIERNIRGYAPVLLKDVELTSSQGRGNPTSAKYPGFLICEEKSDGQRYQRAYAFITNIVRFAGEQPCEPPAVAHPLSPSAPLVTAPEPQARPTLVTRVKNRLRLAAKRWFNR